MAENKQYLTGATGLQFIIVPEGKTYATSTTGVPGVIVFREVEKTIEVNGHKYGADNSTEFKNLSAALTALKNNGLLQETSPDSGVYQVTSDRLGTLNGALAGMTGEATGAQTVSALIEQLQSEIVANATGIYTEGAKAATGIANNAAAIDGIQGEITGTIMPEISGIHAEISGIINGANDRMNSTISSAITTAMTGLGPITKTGTGTNVNVTVTTKGGNVTEVTVNESDIASASGLAAVKATADTAVQSVVVNGVTFGKDGTTATGVISGANILVGGNGAYGASAINVAIDDINTKISNNQSSATLKVYSGESGTTEATAISADGETYRLVQGNTLIASFNIEKDSFVRDGEVVVCGAEGAPTIPEGVTGNHYIHLVINTHDAQSGATGEKDIFIPAESLVDSYTTGSTETDIVQITVDNDHNTISASFAIGAVSKTTTASGASAEANVTANSTVNVLGAVTVSTQDGSVTGVSNTSVLVDAAGAAAAASSHADTLAAANATGIYLEGAKAATGIYNARAEAATGISEAKTAASNASSHADTLAAASATGIYNAETSSKEFAATGAYNAETNAKSYADTIISWEVIS